MPGLKSLPGCLQPNTFAGADNQYKHFLNPDCGMAPIVPDRSHD